MVAGTRLTRVEISEAVTGLGWRFILGTARTSVRVESLAQATRLASRFAEVAGPQGDGSLELDLRPDRLVLTLRSPGISWLTALELDLARDIAGAAEELGVRLDPELSGPGQNVEGGADGAATDNTAAAHPRADQIVEIGIDALDIAAVRPFWRAVMAYGDEPGADGPQDAIVDPVGQGPAIWFQQMDKPRPQRNRIHFDVAVPHDEAAARIAAALAAGGVLVSEASAPSFWVLADVEGNEVCITTWQGRD